jgi:phosphoribosylanthranilate isomerase
VIVSGRLAVKICGLRSAGQAIGAARAGAGLLGFNFAPVSKRRVAVEVARDAIAACRAEVAAAGPVAGGGRAVPLMVGVFVNQAPAEIAAVARTCGLEAVQLSGDEDAALCREVARLTGLPAIKAVRLRAPADAGPAADYVEAGEAAALLVDTPVAGSWGGSGQGWDWTLAAPLARRYPLLLAGGLNAANVGAAVRAVRPWGVDVASGVETDGQTDPLKVAAFYAQAVAASDAAPATGAAPHAR